MDPIPSGVLTEGISQPNHLHYAMHSYFYFTARSTSIRRPQYVSRGVSSGGCIPCSSDNVSFALGTVVLALFDPPFFVPPRGVGHAPYCSCSFLLVSECFPLQRGVANGPRGAVFYAENLKNILKYQRSNAHPRTGRRGDRNVLSLYESFLRRPGPGIHTIHL